MKKLFLSSLLLFSYFSAHSQCCSNGINLLADYNPDFSAPFVDIPPGFTTENPYTTIPTPGTYIIVASRNYGACFNTPQTDHTTGDAATGRFLWFDTGDATIDNPDVAWKPFNPNLPLGSQDLIVVQPNTNYVFSCWIRDLAREGDCVSGGAPLMGLRINGQEMAEVDLALITEPCCPQWIYLCSEWNSGNNTTALIQIESRRVTGFDDLGIDDVYFGTTTEALQFSLGADTTVCEGVTLVIEDNIDNSVNFWSNSSSGDTIQVSSPGIYWLEVTKNNCKARDSILVTQDLLPDINLGNDSSICDQIPLLISPISTGGTISNYLWQDNSIANSFTVNSNGNFWLQASNSCGSSRDSIYINYYFKPSLGKDTSLCDAIGFTLNVGLADSYTWSNGATTPSITTTQSGTFWIETQTEQCVGRDSIEIAFLSTPILNLGPDISFCDKEFTTLTANIADAYLWSDGATSPSINVSNSGIYWVDASNGPCLTRDSVSLEFNSTPFLELGNDTSICQGESITLTSEFANTFLWSNGSNSSTIDVNTAGLYWLQLNNGTCFTRDSISISTELCDIVIELPNSFTPNGDGFNDVFIPKEIQGIANATLRILNRWGSEIFFTENLSQGWNGTFNNKSCTDGTYFWTIEYLNTAGEKIGKAGFLTLMR